MQVYDLEGRIKRYASFFTLTNARGGPIERKATLKINESNSGPTGNKPHLLRAQADQDKSTQSDLEEDDNEEDDSEAEDGPVNYPKLKVSVRHASIVDFFSGKDQEPSAAIHVDSDAAPLQILKTCLYIFTDRETFDSCKAEDGLVRYAEYTFEHLPLVDLSKVGKEEKSEITKLLVQWFQDESTVERWVWRYRQVLSKYLLEQDEFIEAVIKICGDEGVQNHYRAMDSKLFEGLNRMLESDFEERLRPVAMCCSRNWLLEDNWNYEPELAFLRQYLQMVSENHVTGGAIKNVTVRLGDEWYMQWRVPDFIAQV